MGKRRSRQPSGRSLCAYCGLDPGIEDEHVFPEAWYPDTATAEEKLTVPACGPCNRRWGRLEERLLLDLAVVTDPDHPMASGVWERQYRSLNAEHARDAHDARIRSRRAERFIRSISWFVPGVPGAVVVPLPSFAGGPERQGTPTRRIEHTLWVEVAEKFIRGLHYAETGQRLGGLHVTAKVDGAMIVGPPDPAVQATVKWAPADRVIAPGFAYGRRHLRKISLWHFRVWNQISIAALMQPGIDAASVPADMRAISRR